MSRGQKNAILCIVDVRPSMKSHINLAQNAVAKYVQQPLLVPKKFEVGLVLLGSDDTSNHLNDEDPEDYQNITVAQQLDICNCDILKSIKEDIAISSSSGGDLIDALVLAFDMLVQRTKKGKWSKKIVIVSDFKAHLELDEDLETIVTQSDDIDFDFVGIDFDTSSKTTLELCGKLKGKFFAVDSPGDLMQLCQRKPVAATTIFRGQLEITPLLRFNLWAYNLVSESKMPSRKKLSAVSLESDATGNAKVSMDRTYRNPSKPDEEISPEMRVKGYRYGAEYVPFNETDLQAMKWQSDKELKALGFVNVDDIPRSFFCGKSGIFMPPPGDAVTETGLAALLLAMTKMNVACVVRFVKRKNAVPELGCLFASDPADFAGSGRQISLIYTKLPVLEDMREYSFSSFEQDDGATPSPSQLVAARELISAMELHPITNTTGIAQVPYDPTTTFNPVLQRLHRCLAVKSIDPKAELPKVEETIKQMMQPSKHIMKAAANALVNFKRCFPTSVVEQNKKKKKRTFWGDRSSDTTHLDLGLAGDSKRVKLSPDASAASDSLFTAKSLLEDNVKEVGPITPSEDFRKMVSSGIESTIKAAVYQLKQMIRKTVTQGSVYHQKGRRCVMAFRKATVANVAPKSALGCDEFNLFLRELKSLFEKGEQCGFWEQLVSNKISLITKGENSMSTVEQSEADSFIAKASEGAAAPTEESAEEEEEEDDLWDEFD